MISLNNEEKVTEYKSKAYEYENDGFLKSRGDIKYQFNSNGMYDCSLYYKVISSCPN